MKKIIVILVSLLATGYTAQAELQKSTATGVEGAVQGENYTPEVNQGAQLSRQSAQFVFTLPGMTVNPLFTAPSWPEFTEDVIDSLMDNTALTVPLAIPLKAEYLMAPTSGTEGSRVGAPVKITAPSGTTFSFSQVRATINESSGENYLQETISYADKDYSRQAVGHYYGADGVPNTSDDVIRRSGSGTLPVNVLYFVGVGVAYAADDEATKQLIRNHVNANLPFSVSVTYFVWNEAGNAVLASGGVSASTSSIASPRLVIARQGNNVMISIESASTGVEYDIEASNVATSGWQKVGTATSTSGYVAERNSVMAFYRAVKR